MKKFNFTTLTPDQVKRMTKDGNVLGEAGKNIMEFEDFKQMEEAVKKMNRRVYMSQMKIVARLSREDLEKLYDFDGGTRTGFNYRNVTEVGNYCFQEVAKIDQNNVLKRRYFILDYGVAGMVKVEKCIECGYEIDVNTFAILVSDICSAKLDIEKKMEVESAKQSLKDGAEFIKEFIEDYLEKRELEKDLKKK